MPVFNRPWIEAELMKAKSHYGWLNSLNLMPKTIANFGCSGGSETFALSWIFNSSKVVGVDNSRTKLFSAQSYQTEVSEIVNNNNQAVQLVRTRQEDRIWWNQVPQTLRNACLPPFILGDITECTGLVSNHFDLVFCSNVLYIINEDRRLSAVKEMARVAEPNGWIIANEPPTLGLDDKTKVDFSGLFVQAGLVPVKVDSKLHGQNGLYIYKKVANV